MLTEDQKIEIRKLRQEGLNVSQIARKMKLDWKTVKKFVDESRDHKGSDPAKDPEKDDTQDRDEVSKKIFKKLNSGESPEEIIAELGHVDLVIDCYNKWKTLGGHASQNLSPPEPKIFESFNAWLESVDERPEWHHKMAHKSLAAFAFWKLENCTKRGNPNVECEQSEEINPYACLVCTIYSPRKLVTVRAGFLKKCSETI